MEGHVIEYLDVDEDTFVGIKNRLELHGFDVPEGGEGEVRGREIIARIVHDPGRQRLLLELIELPPSITPGYASGWVHDHLLKHVASRGAE